MFTRTLITGYVNPDLDAVACAYAYAEFLNTIGKVAIAGHIGTPKLEAQFVLQHFNIPPLLQVADDTNFANVILVDASDTVGLEGKINSQKVTELLDHRMVNEAHKFTKAKIQIEPVGSCTTLIAEKFISQNLMPSKNSATLLACAIISNTLNFKSTNTTPRDIATYNYLQQIAQLPPDYWLQQFEAKSNLAGTALQSVMQKERAVLQFGGHAVLIVQLECVNAHKIIARQSEILEQLQKMQKEFGCDMAFVTIVAVDEDKNYFVASNSQTALVLNAIFTLGKENDILVKQGMLLRKQIIPLVKKYLEHEN